MNHTYKINRELQKKLSDYHMEYIEMQDNCSLCGSQLKVETQSYSGSDTIKEEAYCPSCKIKTRVKSHTVQ